MADKFIQMSQRNTGNTDWDNLFPSTKFETAGGTATAITVTIPSLADGVSKTFVAKSSNSAAATTINGKYLYKPNTTTAPTLIAGKAYTVWYSASNDCFFIKASATGTVTPDKVLAGETYSTEDDTDLVGAMDLQAKNIKEGVTYGGIAGSLSPRNNVEYIYTKNGYYLRSPFFADDNWFESTASTDNLYKMNINGTIIQTVPRPTSLGDFLTASRNYILTHNSPSHNGLALCNTSGTLLKSISGITLNVTNAYIDEDNSRVIIYNNTTKAVEVYDFDLNLLTSKSLNVDEIVIFIPMAYYVLIYSDAESGVNLLSKSNTFTRYLMYLDKSLVF